MIKWFNELMRKQWQRSPLKVKELIIIHQSPHDFLSKCKTMFFVWISSVCYYSRKPLDLLTLNLQLRQYLHQAGKRSTDREIFRDVQRHGIPLPRFSLIFHFQQISAENTKTHGDTQPSG